MNHGLLSFLNDATPTRARGADPLSWRRTLALVVASLTLLHCGGEPAGAPADAGTGLDSTQGVDGGADAPLAVDASKKDGSSKDVKYSDAQLFPDLPANTSPTVEWLTPLEGAMVPADTPLVATATIADGESPPADLGLAITVTDLLGDNAKLFSENEGLVAFKVPGLAVGPHKLILSVTDGQGGMATAERTVTAVAPLPEPTVTISPAKPVAGEPLHATVEGTWPPGTQVSVQWTRNGELLQWATSPDIAAGVVVRGEEWRVYAQAVGIGTASPAVQAAVVVGNTPPGAFSLALDPTQVHVAGSTWCGLAAPSVDVDGDPVAYTVQWALDDVPLAADVTASLLVLGFAKEGNFAVNVPCSVGQVLTCTVTADDAHGGTATAKVSTTLAANPACSTDANPCSPAADCSPTATAPVTCTCKPGFAGNGIACADVDECVDLANACTADAVCTNSEGSYSCACKPGFQGDGKTCNDIDECAEVPGPCALAADCTNTAGSYTCTCKGGYAGDGYSCTNVDECAVGLAQCATTAVCTDTNGSYLCACTSGFTGDGSTCTDIDECASVELANCATEAVCLNLPGWHTCTCKDGYVGSGDVCEDVDECAAATPVCSANATCTNSPGDYQCACNPGYVGDGLQCADVDECATGQDNCSIFASCTNNDGGFSCECQPGYAGDGTNCVAQ